MELENETQDKILESLTANDYNNIILPNDDFFDCQNGSSSSDDEDINDKNKKNLLRKFKYKKYSTYYICKTIFENYKNIKFIEKININELTVYNRDLPWFDDNLFALLLEFCKKETKNIIFNPDYIINDIKGKYLKEKIEKYK